MIDLNDLLTQWAALQPERCQASTDSMGNAIVGEIYFNITDIEFDENYWLPVDCSLVDLSMLQSSLQLAIAAKDARCRLENSSKGWHVTIGRPEPKSSNFQILVFGKNDVPALAMLETWIKFLQAEVKLAPESVSAS